jgi:hypothetical protein
MVVANKASTWGEKVEAIKAQTEAIRKENLNLRTELAQKSGGLTELHLLAQNKGFTSEVNIQYFPTPASVALTRP